MLGVERTVYSLARPGWGMFCDVGAAMEEVFRSGAQDMEVDGLCEVVGLFTGR